MDTHTCKFILAHICIMKHLQAVYILTLVRLSFCLYSTIQPELGAELLFRNIKPLVQSLAFPVNGSQIPGQGKSLSSDFKESQWPGKVENT